ncbi:MAG: hypothetical protein WCJ30_26280 [Deltaproteobacteria bacterium]
MDIESRLDRIERKLDAVLAALRGGSVAAQRNPAASPSTAPSRAPVNAVANSSTRAPGAGVSSGSGDAGRELARDVDLDGPRGDPEVRFAPKRWSGADYRGKRYSQCSPDFLDMLADTLEWFARRDDDSGAVDRNGNPKGKWGRLDAARARGWSQRLRRDGGDFQDDQGDSLGPDPGEPVDDNDSPF